MSWEQFVIFVFAMLITNVLSHALIRGFFERNITVKRYEESEESDSDGFTVQQVVSNRISDIWRELNYLRSEIEKKVNESVCEVRMEKLEVVIEEIKKRLESIEGKIDRILGRKEG
jgi:hypothetical protein